MLSFSYCQTKPFRGFIAGKKSTLFYQLEMKGNSCITVLDQTISNQGITFYLLTVILKKWKLPESQTKQEKRLKKHIQSDTSITEETHSFLDLYVCILLERQLFPDGFSQILGYS